MEAVYWNELTTVDLKTHYIYRSVHLGHKRSHSNHPKCMFDGAIASGFSKYYGNCKKVKHHSLTRKVYMTFRHCSKTWAKWILGLHGTFKWLPHFSTFNVFASHTIIYTIELLGEKNIYTFPCTDLIESIQAKLWHCFVHCLNQVQQLSMASTHLQCQKGPAADRTTMRNQSHILQMANWQLKELTVPRSLSVTIDLQSLGSAHKPGNGGKKNQKHS